MTYVDAVFLHSWLLQLIESDVTVVFINPDLNGTTGLSNVHLHTLSGGTVYTQCFQANIILHWLIEAGDSSWWKVYHCDMLRPCRCGWMCFGWRTGRPLTWGPALLLVWVESPVDAFCAVTILMKGSVQFGMETILALAMYNEVDSTDCLLARSSSDFTLR